MTKEPNINLRDLTNDEKCIMSWLNGASGPTEVRVGGEGAEATLSHRAALAMLSLIGRGLIQAQIFNNTGRVVYRATELAAPLKGKVTRSFLDQHGRWPLTEPHPFRK